jgi:hypothetical protein
VWKVMVPPPEKLRLAIGSLLSPRASSTLSAALASKEVILAAGAYNSPKLLMLSGVGNCEELEAVGIDCLVDSPGWSPGRLTGFQFHLDCRGIRRVE